MAAVIDKVAVQRLLIVRLGAIGDCLRVLPALERLRAELPRATIGWLVEDWVAPVLKGHPSIDRLHLLDRNRMRAGDSFGPSSVLAAYRRMKAELVEADYDVAVDFHARLKSGIFTRASGAPVRIGFDRRSGTELNYLFTTHHVSSQDIWQNRVTRNLALLAPLGLRTDFDPCARGLWLTPEEKEKAVGWYRAAGSPAVAAFPGSSLHRRADRWPVARWQEALKALGAAGHASVLFWGPSEMELAGEIVAGAGPLCTLAPPTTLREMMAMLGLFGVYLGSNTAALHMAWMQDTPSVVLVGGRPSRTDAPLAPVPSLMLRAGPEPKAKLHGEASRKAMEGIEVAEVVRAVTGLLARRTF